MAEKIGEGTYGCVYRPRLSCRDEGNLSEKQKRQSISKLLPEQNQEITIENEFGILFDKIDPRGNFHLVGAIECSPNLDTSEGIKAIRDCGVLNALGIRSDNLEDQAVSTIGVEKPGKKIKDQVRMVVQPYGGISLFDIGTSLLKDKPMVAFSQSSALTLLKGFVGLFEGLVKTEEAGICHLDLHPGNILFNPETNKLVMIDFGLMQKKADIEQLLLGPTGNTAPNMLVGPHWAYPYETVVMRRYLFDEYMKIPTQSGRVEWLGKRYNRGDEKKDKLRKLFNFVDRHHVPGGTLSERNKVTASLRRFDDGIREMFGPKNRYGLTYDAFLRSLPMNVDTYMVGLTLQYILEIFYNKGLVSFGRFKQLLPFAMRLRDPDLRKRVTQRDGLASEWLSLIDTAPSLSQSPFLSSEPLRSLDPLIQKPRVKIYTLKKRKVKKGTTGKRRKGKKTHRRHRRK